MKSKPKASFRTFLIFALAASCVAAAGSGDARTAAASTAARDSEQLAVQYPPGGVAVFPESVGVCPGDKPVVYIKREGESAEWILKAGLSEPRGELAGAGDSSAVQQFVTFTVPQLPRGVYVARYELTACPEAKGSMRLSIGPELHAAGGVVAGSPGDVLEVKVGIDMTRAIRREDSKPEPARANVTLASRDASVATLAPDQQESVATDADGYARWKVRIAKCDVAVMEATAPGFEPAEVYVVCPLPPAAKKEAAQRAMKEVELARSKTARTEEAARAVRAQYELARAELEQVSPTLGGPLKEKPGQGTLEARRFKLAELSMESTLRELAAARDRLYAAEVRADLLTHPAASEDVLQPGDVLLVRGNNIISYAIRAFEAREFNRLAEYSHAALYMGEDGGRPMVAEMLKGGYTYQPLDASIQDDSIVDVYRWKDGLNQAQRDQIISSTKSFAGKYYAFPQIDVLRAGAGVFFLPSEQFIPLSARAAIADLVSGGERQMICSEMVVWAYHHAGLDPEATRLWRNLDGILNGDARQHDYTTPNALAASEKFKYVGRLKPRL